MNQQTNMAETAAADLVQGIATRLYGDAGAGITDLITLTDRVQADMGNPVSPCPAGQGGGRLIGWSMIDGMRVFSVSAHASILDPQQFVRYDDHLAALAARPPLVTCSWCKAHHESLICDRCVGEAERAAEQVAERAARQPVGPTFQDGVAEWMGQCFLPSLHSNMTERGDRLLEEVLELLQAHGYDQARVRTLADYVFGRPVGEPAQEVGGVMVTLAGYCWVAGLDMHAAGDAELARINQPEVMEKIRQKQEAKNARHFDTPLPGNDASQPVGQEPVVYQIREEIVGENSWASSNLTIKEKLNAWREIPKSYYDAYVAVMGGCGPMGVIGHPDGPVKLELNRYHRKTEVRALYAAPPAQAVDLGQVSRGVRLIEIPGRNGLDPINVFVQDYQLGRGRIVVTCYGQAWCGFWGAMGGRTVMEFVAACDAEYVASNMLSGRQERVLKRDRAYVERIATEVITQFRALIDSGKAVQS